MQETQETGLITGSGPPPRGGSGNPLQYSCLEIRGQRSLAGYSPWGRKELDTTEWTSPRYQYLSSGNQQSCFHSFKRRLSFISVPIYFTLAVDSQDRKANETCSLLWRDSEPGEEDSHRECSRKLQLLVVWVVRTQTEEGGGTQEVVLRKVNSLWTKAWRISRPLPTASFLENWVGGRKRILG